MDLNPFRRSPLPPLPPITEAEYLSFTPPPSPQEIRAEQLRYRQQKRQQLLQAGYSQSQIVFSEEDDGSYQEESSFSLQDSYSQSSYCNDILNHGMAVDYSRSSSHPTLTSKRIHSPPAHQQMKQQPPSQLQFQLDQQTQKLLLIHEYLQVAALTERMIFSPKINKLLTSDEFVDSHSLQQIQQYINSLAIPSAPTWQEQINTRQARGEGEFVSDAVMWDLEQQILQMIREKNQS